MIRSFLRLHLVLGILLAVSGLRAQCLYQIRLTDSAGDGWETGSEIEVNNGMQTFTYTLNDGDAQAFYFPVVDGDTLTLNFLTPQFDIEAGVELYDADGQVLLSFFGFFGSIQIYNDLAVCPACAKPIEFTLDDYWDNRARFTWLPGSTDAPQGWNVVYGPAGFLPGEGDTLFVLTPKATVTGLTPYTDYDAYVQTVCDTNAFSDLVGPISFRTYRSNDVGIVGVVTPRGGCVPGFEEVEVQIRNFGAKPQSLVRLDFSVDGIPAGVSQPQDGLYTGVLGKDSVDNFLFDANGNFSTPGEHLITVFTQLVGDEDTSNDTFNFYVAYQLPAPYNQGFEVWNGGWTVDSNSVNASWAYGKPGKIVISEAAEGETAWVTSIDGDYNPEEISYLVSPCFGFQDLTEDPVIELSIYRDLEPEFDGAFLELSTDDGETWSRVGDIGNGINWYNENNTELDLGNVWSGDSEGWVFARNYLTGAAGSSTVRLRFGIGADKFLQGEGFGIDQVRIRVPDQADLAGLDAKTIGNNTTCGIDEDRVQFTLANLGTQTQNLYAVAYSINGGAPVIDTLANDSIQPDEIFVYTFDSTFNSVAGLFDIKCWTILAGEQRPSNDTVFYTVDHRATPVPAQENFESGVLPEDWTVDNAFVDPGHNNVSFVLAANLFEFSPLFEAESSVYGPIGAGYKFSFDYRITNFSGDGTEATQLDPGNRIDLELSADCGESFNTVYSISDANHAPSVDLQTVTIDLDDYEGDLMVFRFVGQHGGTNDYWFDVDNINFLVCPASFQLTADVTPTAPGEAKGAATVQVGAGNPPYDYLWSDGQTTQTASNLAEGEYTVTVTDKFGCSDVLVVAIQSVGVEDLPGLSTFLMHPNPTNAQLFVSAGFDATHNLSAEVLDMLGRPLLETNRYGQELNAVFDLSAYPAGLYLLRLTADGRSMVRKVVRK